MPTMDIRTRSVKAVEKDHGGAYPANIINNMPNNQGLSYTIKHSGDY